LKSFLHGLYEILVFGPSTGHDHGDSHDGKIQFGSYFFRLFTVLMLHPIKRIFNNRYHMNFAAF
jgi:hypothetical protein